jgi:phospholipid/cholesterol/gamma-HCH transport system substrate-binding protein
LSVGGHPGLKFAVFAFVCLLSGVWLVYTIGNFTVQGLSLPGISPVGSTTSYTVKLPNAAGLSSGASVLVSGTKAGRVSSIKLEDGLAVAQIEVEKDLPVTDAWQMGVQFRTLLGQRYLYLYPQEGGQRLAAGGTLPAGQARRAADLSRFLSELSPILEGLEPQRVNTIVQALNTAVSGKEDRIRSLVDELGSLTTTLASRDQQISSLIDNANQLVGAYARRDGELRGLLTDAAEVSETVAARNDELVGAVTDIAEFQSEVRDVLAENEPELRGITNQFAQTSETIGNHRGELESAIDTLPQGLATYNLISRWGQWFNIRTVAMQAQKDGELLFCRTETGGSCYAPNGSGTGAGSGSQSGSDTGSEAGGGDGSSSATPAIPSLTSQALGDGSSGGGNR